LGGVASVVAIPAGNFFAGKVSSNSDIAKVAGEPVVLSLIANEREIFEIGGTIQSQHSETIDADKLIMMVLDGIPEHCYIPNLNEPEFKLNISKKIQTEFKNQEIKVVNGWVLSKTESIQCHLYHLLSTQQ